MKLHNLILITFIGFFLTACTEPSLEGASVGINSKPALWVAKSEHSTVYLFGSMHILPKEVKWYGPKVREGFEGSDELVFESVKSKKNIQQFIEYNKKHGLLPEGKVISDYLSASEYEKYSEIVEAVKMDKYYANRMKPWLFSLSISVVANKQFSPYGVDTLLQKEALKRGKRVSALESAHNGLSAFSSIPLEKDIKNLKKMLGQEVDEKRRKENFEKRIEMLVSWTQGDTARTQRMIAQGMTSDMYNKLILKRNNQWYPKVKNYLKKKQTTMIVVGQAHLLGRGNIIDKLKREGYKVQRVQ